MATGGGNVSDVCLDKYTHIQAPDLSKVTEKESICLSEFQEAAQRLEVVKENPDFLSFTEKEVLIRFLIARDWQVKKSLKMLLEALRWRSRRPSHRWCLANDPDRCKLFRYHASLGKIYVPGVDIHGRPVMVFDNSKENSNSADEMMQFLAWNMEFCRRTAQAPADKIMLFMHLTDFSFFNQPPMAVTKETITILSIAFPESLGTCVILNAPAAFRLFWNAVSRLIDPKTRSKVFMLSGDISDGSKNDNMMQQIVGPNWKKLTGAGQPIHDSAYSTKASKVIDASPGFELNTYWKSVMERETSWEQEKHPKEAAAEKIESGRMIPKATHKSPSKKDSKRKLSFFKSRNGIMKREDMYTELKPAAPCEKSKRVQESTDTKTIMMANQVSIDDTRKSKSSSPWVLLVLPPVLAIIILVALLDATTPLPVEAATTAP